MVFDAPIEEISEEARSLLGSLVAGVISFIRMLVSYLVDFARKIVASAWENPLAFILAVGNIIIWTTQ